MGVLAVAIGRYPQPPVSMRLDETTQLLFTIACGIPAVVALVLAVRWRRTHRTWVPLLLLAGTLFLSLLEPVLDVLGLAWHPRQHQVVGGIFETFGRPIPLFVILVYAWYFGAQAWLTWWRLERAGPRQVWALFGLFVLADLVLESPGTVFHAYTYYGNQPLDPWGFPLYWAVLNAVAPVTTGAIVYALRSDLKTGWRSVVVVPVTVMGSTMSYLAVGLPIFSALNTDQTTAVTTAAAFLTIGLAFLYVALLSGAVSLIAVAKKSRVAGFAPVNGVAGAIPAGGAQAAPR
jgi:hypothetical protein